MAKYNIFTTTFYLRSKEDFKRFYMRPDFWVSLVAVVLAILSLVLKRYCSSNGDGASFVQIWRAMSDNWILILCGLFSIIAMSYIFIINFLFRNNAKLSGINIALGILVVVLYIVEYIIFTKVGVNHNGSVVTTSQSPGVAFYLGILGGIVAAGLEFYKLGAQGYYSSEDIINEKEGITPAQKDEQKEVQVVDGQVIVDGENVMTNENVDKNENAVKMPKMPKMPKADTKKVDNNEE